MAHAESQRRDSQVARVCVALAPTKLQKDMTSLNPLKKHMQTSADTKSLHSLIAHYSFNTMFIQLLIQHANHTSANQRRDHGREDRRQDRSRRKRG